MGIDPMADAAGQQGLSPYHAMAMACNPSTMTDPLGLAAKTEGHAGSFIDYAGEMFRRFPTIMNFMARYVNFGERTASQSMAEQQIEVQEFHRKQYEEATTGGGNAQESNAGTQIEKGAGVDYIFDGTSVSEETVANGLDENRIVIYKKRKKGETENEIRDMVPLGNRILPNHSTENKHSRFEFRNFGDGAIEVWDFFSRNSGNEWALTEYKVGNVVSSIIISKNHNMHSGVVFRNSKASDYIYWVTVHSHPRGGVLDYLITQMITSIVM
ncbi:hypothetical protein D3C71_52730 [compost metagenome]